MLEYLYNAIRVTAGADEAIAAKVTDEVGEPITAGCQLILYPDDNTMITIEGDYIDGVWMFSLPADMTKDLKGRCWYYIKHDSEQLCFKQPIYFV